MQYFDLLFTYKGQANFMLLKSVSQGIWISQNALYSCTISQGAIPRVIILGSQCIMSVQTCVRSYGYMSQPRCYPTTNVHESVKGSQFSQLRSYQSNNV